MIRHGKPPYLECSSRGVKQLSAFCARVKSKDNKTIEELYQAFKIFEDGSTGLHWKQAKGRKAINAEDCAEYYSHLWNLYMAENPELMKPIMEATGLSDCFGQEGHCCQATELWRIRNEAFWAILNAADNLRITAGSLGMHDLARDVASLIHKYNLTENHDG